MHAQHLSRRGIYNTRLPLINFYSPAAIDEEHKQNRSSSTRQKTGLSSFSKSFLELDEFDWSNPSLICQAPSVDECSMPHSMNNYRI